MFSIRHTSPHKIWTIITTMMLSLFIFSVSAHGAVVPGTKFSGSKTQTVKASLASITGDQDEILDWRRTETEINFALPPGEWANAITLDLSALPQGNMNADTPLKVSLNGGKAVEIESRGQQFVANISFPVSKLRKVNNVLTLSFNAQDDQECLTSAAGAWVIDMARSTLILEMRNQPRDFRLSEIERRLNDPFVAPKRVAILARGSNALTYEALTAQGIGLRMDSLPTFKTNGAADLTVMVGTRKDLGARIKDRAITESRGAQIGVMDGRPMTLILTGDTQAQVLESAKAFATYHLPAVRREITTPGELEIQNAFTQDDVQARGKALLSTLGATGFDMSYRPKPVKLSFKVDDPKTASADLVLDLSRNGIAGPNSRVDVTLNGRALGYAVMNRSKKRVSFPVPTGSFRATSNELIITPTLEAKSEGCIAYNYEPSLNLGRKSYLAINSPRSADTASLSRLAGSGAPFSVDHASNTAVVITGQNPTDRAASFSVLARLAKTSGQGWSNAQFSSQMSDIDAKRNIIFIGPMGDHKHTLLSTAPRSFVDATKGIPARSNQDTRPVSVVTADPARAFQIAANRSAPQGAKVYARGLASVYQSPLSSRAVIGVITTSQPSGFAQSVKPLTQDTHWNDLQGGVARWNRKTVLMTQANTPNLSPYSSAPQAPSDMSGRFAALSQNTNRLASNIASKFSRKPKPSPNSPPVQAIAEMTASKPVTTPVQKPARTRANPQQMAALTTPQFTVPSLRGRKPAAITAPYTNGPSTQTSSLGSFFDMSGFDYTYFKANLSNKTRAARNNIVRFIGGHMSREDIRSSWSAVKADKTLWLTLMGILVILGLLFASPKSANRHY